MSDEFWLDADDFEGPWMAWVEPDEEVNFELDIGSVEVIQDEILFKTHDKPVDIKQYKAEMQDILTPDGDMVAEDGEYVIPFWACRAFKQAVKAAKQREGWLEMVYKRTVEDRKGTKYNTAHFGLR
jgi:hypothetical protein